MKLAMRSFAVGLGLVSAAAFGQTTPPGIVTINNVIWGGTGCTQENAAVQITPDKTQFTLLFDNYIAEKVAGGAPMVRSNCNVQAVLNVPSGWSYSLMAVEYVGYYYLDQGVTAVQESRYRFVDPGNPFATQARFTSTFRGPASDSYFFTDRLAVIGSVWSPCSVKRPLQISTELRVTGPSTNYGYISLDQLSGSVDTKYHHKYYISWKKC
jgi:hypothetical protein